MRGHTPFLNVPKSQLFVSEGSKEPMTLSRPVSAAQITQRRFNADRLFYVLAAGAMLIFTAGGFRNFYLHGKAPWGAMTSQIMPLIVAHGLAMSGWVLLFFFQSILILTGRRRLHVVIGPLGGVLAGAIVILGTTVAPFCSLQPVRLRNAGGPEAFFGHDVRTDAFVRNVRGNRIGVSPPPRDPSPDDAAGHHRNPVWIAWPVSLHPRPCGCSAVRLGTGVTSRGLAFPSSMGNEPNPEPVVFDGLRRDGGGVLTVRRRGHLRGLEPDAPYLRLMKTVRTSR